jgi:hypothetical protein
MIYHVLFAAGLLLVALGQGDGALVEGTGENWAALGSLLQNGPKRPRLVVSDASSPSANVNPSYTSIFQTPTKMTPLSSYDREDTTPIGPATYFQRNLHPPSTPQKSQKWSDFNTLPPKSPDSTSFLQRINTVWATPPGRKWSSAGNFHQVHRPLHTPRTPQKSRQFRVRDVNLWEKPADKLIEMSSQAPLALLALVCVALACFTFFTKYNSRRVQIPQSLLG